MSSVLHILAQRPSMTGSGVTLEALAAQADASGWDQRAIVGVPAGDRPPKVGPIPAENIFPLRFGTRELPFPVPGMSDLMPYRSTIYASMTGTQVAAYESAWTRHIGAIIEARRPDLIHSHHVWIVSSLLKTIAPSIPVVTHCHATGLRQMALCPALAGNVRRRCRAIDRFCVLHRGHAIELARELDVPQDRIQVVGAGFRTDIFRTEAPPCGSSTTGGSERERRAILYTGKLSRAKGLPWLLDAIERLSPGLPGLVLHVAGSGDGHEADELRARMQRLHPLVRYHGQLAQDDLAVLMRRCALFVLPSFYEGLPLVLVEALACGCRLVCTRLPGVAEQLAPALGPALELVDLPRLKGVDTPLPEDLPAFVAHLAETVEQTLAQPPLEPDGLGAILEPFTWRAVFQRVERVWSDVVPVG